MLAANSVAIVVAAVPEEERGFGLGLQATAQALGLSLGPVFGGLLLQWLDWRWVFWINVPIGLLGVISAWAILPTSKEMDKGQRMDIPGALLLVPALLSLLLAVNRSEHGLLAPLPLGLAGLAVMLLAIFLFVERKTSQPLVDLSLLSDRSFILGSLAGLAAFGELFGLFLATPFVFERVFKETPLTAGLALAAIPAAYGLVAPISGALSAKVDGRWLKVPGMIVAIVGLVWLWHDLHTAQHSVLSVIAAISLAGVGQGLFVSANNNDVMSAAPPSLRGEAGSVLNVFRMLGMSIGIAAASSLMSARLTAYAGGKTTTLNAPPAAMREAAAEVALLLAAFALVAALLSLFVESRHGDASGRQKRAGTSRAEA